jgi:ABC-type multidrug transport system fused ATPase/permease subunit
LRRPAISLLATPYPVLLRLVRGHLGTAPVVVGLGLLAAVMEGLGIGLLIPVLASLQAPAFDAHPGVATWLTRYADLFQPRLRLPALCATILVVICTKSLLTAVNHRYVSWVDGRISHGIRVELARRLMHVGFRFFVNHDSGRLLHIISSDSWRASAAVREAFGLVIGLVTALVFSLFLVALSWRLAAITLVGVVTIYGLRQAMSRRLRARSLAFSAANATLASRMIEAIESSRLMRAFGTERRWLDRFADASAQVRTTQLALDRVTTTIPPAMEAFQAALFVMVLLGTWWSGYGFGTMAAFLVVLYRLQPHVQLVASAHTRLQACAGPLEEIEWLLDPRDKPPAPAGRLPFQGFQRAIEFRAVAFTYEDRSSRRHTVLSDGSFIIPKGQTMALLGPSGAGKSTVVNLLCRLIEPDSGDILVDGQPLRTIDPESWRSRIALAGQDLDLLEGTIADNIGFGKADASAEEIETAARAADAHGFIAAMAEGYQTPVGPRGQALSGGQRQRIALARALVRRPEILILDEATNAVDGLSERAIIDNLRSMRMEGLTIILISHRRSAVDYCDHAVVFEKERLLPQVPHEAMPGPRALLAK